MLEAINETRRYLGDEYVHRSWLFDQLFYALLDVPVERAPMNAIRFL